MLSEGRHLIQSGVNPNGLFLDDVEYLYVPEESEKFGEGSTNLTGIPLSFLKGAIKEYTEKPDGTYEVWDYESQTLTIYADKTKSLVLSERALKEGERKPHGKKEPI